MMTLLDMVRVNPSLSEANNQHPPTTTLHQYEQMNLLMIVTYGAFFISHTLSLAASLSALVMF